jgi:hypothetical protein
VRWKRRLFWAICVLLNLAALELGLGLVASRYGGLFTGTVFGPPDDFIGNNLDPASYREYLAKVYHPTTGWENLKSTTRPRPNCLGAPTSFTVDDLGARLGSGAAEPRILLVGDSYTFGDEVDDHQTYASRLQVLTGQGVVNYGVRGFGPLQARLLFEDKIRHHSSVDTVVLGVMYENIARMINSYRPVMHPYSREIFGFKPYIEIRADGVIERANANGPTPKPFAEVRRLALRAMDSDYWARPAARFPYAITYSGAAFAPGFRHFVRQKLNRLFGTDELGHLYRDEDLSRGLAYVVATFVDSARKRGVRPVVMFIPMSGRDRVSVDPLIARLRQSHPKIGIHNAGHADIDWRRYTIKVNHCHPSPYGHRALAAFLASALTAGSAKETGSARGPSARERPDQHARRDR